MYLNEDMEDVEFESDNFEVRNNVGHDHDAMSDFYYKYMLRVLLVRMDYLDIK